MASKEWEITVVQPKIDENGLCPHGVPAETWCAKCLQEVLFEKKEKRASLTSATEGERDARAVCLRCDGFNELTRRKDLGRGIPDDWWCSNCKMVIPDDLARLKPGRAAAGVGAESPEGK